MSDALPEARCDEPITTARIAADLRALGVEAGDTLLVHSSLSALGWVAGGPPAVVDALQSVVTETGTLVLPTHTSQLSDPKDWSNPPIPESWHQPFRDAVSPYRPAVTPCPRVGSVPDCFRSYPGVERSAHPLYSFAAWGADAADVVADHPLDTGLGPGSPLEAVYDRGGYVLQLGTDHNTNTSLHLAEHRADWAKPTDEAGAPMLRGGDREWVEWTELATDTDDFPNCGAAFAAAHPEAVTTGEVGVADTTLLDQRALVDFGTEWFGENREA
ncbi:aminoglycoside N(3)-acetyltransferase [Halorarius litoreus]|uniref:aminoglycoside N(3)-acetyltransferase n=1 Tax=Halorarius litoreus TaxID=2962676 RepID=UPI0020CF4675|nr:AAC(3) family N-acetyltransferase [Halorarius litoreus]